MLSPALSDRSQVISGHLRDVGIFIYSTVGYICYRGKEPRVNKMKWTGRDNHSEATRHGGLGCRSIPI
jgi:hypothetical protein